ncbi:hypothetical protein CUB97_11465 [Prevotella intermedia]|uniref:Uncharacterized protein n=1 Tax=Prevotella intermedia TaxID=28131 RepID=A0A2M8M439_PREIN|nr:hypothetical protein CUB97_11465 [Prevotella intermedia]
MHGKSGSFASQNSRFRIAKSKLPFFVGTIFTKMGDLFETARKKHWKLQWKILKLRCKNFKTAMQGLLGCHKKNKARMLHSLRAS